MATLSMAPTALDSDVAHWSFPVLFGHRRVRDRFKTHPKQASRHLGLKRDGAPVALQALETGCP